MLRFANGTVRRCARCSERSAAVSAFAGRPAPMRSRYAASSLSFISTSLHPQAGFRSSDEVRPGSRLAVDFVGSVRRLSEAGECARANRRPAVIACPASPAHREGVASVSKFLYLYRGPATPMEDFTPEQGAEQARAWGEWMAKVGPSLADGGAPFGARAAVSDDGTAPEPSDQNGYTIVEADD